MRKLIVGIVIVLVLGIVADVVALGVASKNLRQQISKNVPHDGKTYGRVRSFPFISRFALTGTIGQMTAGVDGVDAAGLHFEQVSAELRGVKIDQGVMLRERRIRLIDIKSGTVSAIISDTEISRLTGQTIKFTPGKASLTLGGFTVSANVGISNGQITLQISGPLPIPAPPIALPIPRAAAPVLR